MWLGSGIVVTVAQADGYGSDSTPSLRTSLYCKCGCQKKKKALFILPSLLASSSSLLLLSPHLPLPTSGTFVITLDLFPERT